MSDSLNKLYQDLCQSLGDAEFQRSILERRIEELKARIEAVNNLAPSVRSIIKNAVEQANVKGQGN